MIIDFATSSALANEGDAYAPRVAQPLDMDEHITWDTGAAVASAAYSMGRDADGTNQMHLNVPSGAGWEFSIADTAKLTYATGAFTFKEATTLSTSTGNLTVSVPADQDIFLGDGTTIVTVDGGDHLLNVHRNTTKTNDYEAMMRMQINTSNTPANLLGAAIRTQVERGSDGNLEGAVDLISRAGVIDDTSGNFRGEFAVKTNTGGTMYERMVVRQGVVVGSHTDQGAGTINCTKVYISDSQEHPDFVFDDDYDLMPIEDMAEFYEQERHLPTIKGKEHWDEGWSVGDLSRMLWETVEVQARYIADLNKRLESLEV